MLRDSDKDYSKLFSSVLTSGWGMTSEKRGWREWNPAEELRYVWRKVSKKKMSKTGGISSVLTGSQILTRLIMVMTLMALEMVRFNSRYLCCFGYIPR